MSTARDRELLHPLPLSAVALLALNDHVLKQCAWAPRALTGKLSDFAGLFFFPILLVELARRARPAIARSTAAVTAAALTALVFTAIKLDPRANTAAAWFLGSCARDPSDLIALPVTALAALWLIHPSPAPPREGRRWARTAAMLAAAFASIATSRPHGPRCPATPSTEEHRSWDTLCARITGGSGARVLTDGAAVFIELDVTPTTAPCVLPARGFAIDQAVRADLSARTIAPPPAAAIEQASRLRVQAQLPYAATCGALSLGLLVDDAIVDVPILSCGPKGAP